MDGVSYPISFGPVDILTRDIEQLHIEEVATVAVVWWRRPLMPTMVPPSSVMEHDYYSSGKHECGTQKG